MAALKKWGGAAARRWVAAVLARYGRVCWLQLDGCTRVATTGDHVIPRSVNPALEYVVSNGRPACLNCNRKRGARPADRVVVDARAFFENRPGPRPDCGGSPPRDSENLGRVRFGSGGDRS